jgi:hypothetical protein
MILTSKTLGSALMALLATSALFASSAFAQAGMLTSDGPVTLTGQGSETLTAFGLKSECSATYTWHKYNVTPHTSITSGESTFTITPHYENCDPFLPIGGPVTVEMNGCDYVLHLESTTGTDRYGARTTFACPEGKHIQVTMFENEAKHKEGKAFCVFTITETAAGYTGLQATDTTNGELLIAGTLEGLTIHRKGGGLFCPEGTTNVGQNDFSLTLGGRNEIGVTTAVALSHS